LEKSSDLDSSGLVEAFYSEDFGERKTKRSFCGVAAGSIKKGKSHSNPDFLLLVQR